MPYSVASNLEMLPSASNTFVIVLSSGGADVQNTCEFRHTRVRLDPQASADSGWRSRRIEMIR